MIIKTKRLTLRPFKNIDFQETYDIYKDEQTCRFLLHGAWDQTNAQEEFDRKVSKNILDKDHALSLAVLHEDKVIGDLSIWYTDKKETVEIGYSFNRLSSGNGYASEAVHEMIHQLFYELGVHRIQINMDARNKNSQNVCLRMGMRQEAHFIQDYWYKGEWSDSLVYGLLDSEYDNQLIY
ncbi:GNAT family N-acetyltransferase [Marinilactibacillus kalidii]|uniref:GNAT family N-acetyltransferase n=1 Tax=Marinilactibacillus kalidii TaxID=2820274 RepID=UPI001ABE47FB|nr:GNAT family protein [Marinilactibacillus kalidii]